MKFNFNPIGVFHNSLLLETTQFCINCQPGYTTRDNPLISVQTTMSLKIFSNFLRVMCLAKYMYIGIRLSISPWIWLFFMMMATADFYSWLELQALKQYVEWLTKQNISGSTKCGKQLMSNTRRTLLRKTKLYIDILYVHNTHYIYTYNTTYII